MYTVVENTPGFLPEDDDPFTTDDFDEAVRYAKELLHHICDNYIDISSEEGIPGLYHVNQEHETLWRVTFNDPHQLDRVVEIIDCN